jgi:hypothetical protein
MILESGESYATIPPFPTVLPTAATARSLMVAVAVAAETRAEEALRVVRALAAAAPAAVAVPLLMSTLAAAPQAAAI